MTHHISNILKKYNLKIDRTYQQPVDKSYVYYISYDTIYEDEKQRIKLFDELHQIILDLFKPNITLPPYVKYCLNTSSLAGHGFCFETKSIRRNIESIDEIEDDEWWLTAIYKYLNNYTMDKEQRDYVWRQRRCIESQHI